MKKRGPRKSASVAKKSRAKNDAPVEQEVAAEERKAIPTSNANPAIVGIGASAGGLEAFMRLVRNLTPDTGLAYVLVQHLAREHESLLPELLGRAATIPVEQARDGIRIRADHIYVIPPDATMTVTDGHLRLVQRPKDGGLHLPIDAFLESLADVHGPGAIAVILSGAGSDGSRGVDAIKESGGIVFAQDSESASQPSMPAAAIATGSVDFVLAPEAIAEQLAKIGQYFTENGEYEPAADKAATGEADVNNVLRLLQRRTDVDFSQYRRGTVHRRILRRMLVNRQEKRSDYATFVRNNPAELDFLYQDLLIGVTSFFRDPEVFDELRATALPELLRTRNPDAPFRVWVAGCSGGEETYSLAITLIEFFEAEGVDTPIQIFGTDLNEAAVNRARAGVYPESIASHVSPERLRRFFVLGEGGYRIAKFVRDLCIFSRQNIVRDPPFSHLDLISCRNVLIYFESALQRRVFPIFHYALEPYGMMLLGTAESPGASELFEPINKKQKIYRRRDRTSSPLSVEFAKRAGPELGVLKAIALPAPVAGTRVKRSDDLNADIDRLLSNHFGRVGVVVNEDFTITLFRGDTRPFLAHAAGSASLDLLRLARADLVSPLRSALGRAIAENEVVRASHFATVDNGEQEVTIQVLPIPSEKAARRLFLVLFQEESVQPPRGAPGANGGNGKSRRSQKEQSEVEMLREQMSSTKAHLSEVVEKHAATVEELRAVGEEIQSSNEELQSTNEELETTKEEVQSTNEELSTLNDELSHRNRELGDLASDLANVLASTTIPIVIVGRDLRIRRFTPATNRVMKVIPTDAGRPFSDVKLCFQLPSLESLITASIETLEMSRHLILDDDQSWWALTIRPYLTVDRRVEGAVLVFSDGAEASDERRRALAGAELSEERRLALEAAETARGLALRANDAMAASLQSRERAEMDRNTLRRELDSVQDEERRRLSRELHDEVGQHLTALGLGLHALSSVSQPGSEVDRRVEELRTLVERLGEELHGIALRLRPGVLDDFGLEPALTGYAMEWSKSSNIAVDVHAPEEPERLPRLIEGAVYRVTQEALNNIAKHSGATRASLTIERRDGHLHVIVEDDGKGFDYDPLASAPLPGVGLGLLGIRERMVLLGGNVEIETNPGRGTTLYIRVPLAIPKVANGGGGGEVAE